MHTACHDIPRTYMWTQRRSLPGHRFQCRLNSHEARVARQIVVHGDCRGRECSGAEYDGEFRLCGIDLEGERTARHQPLGYLRNQATIERETVPIPTREREAR